MTTPLNIRWFSFLADTPAVRMDAGCAFWSGVTGWPIGEPLGDEQEYLPLVPPDGDRYLWLQRIGSGAGGWHLDLHVPELEPAARAAESLGARAVRRMPELAVFETPAGQSFCLVVEEPAQRRHRPAAPRWPGGRSVVDQICLDIPAPAYGAECRFWSQLTGWPLLGRPDDAPEFERVAVPEHLPIQFLFQRLGADDSGGCRAHADLAADDRAAEVARHEQLGATFVRRTDGWTTLRDPAGLLYCVTDRTPGTRVRAGAVS